MAKITPARVLKDLLIIAMSIAVVWLGMQFFFGTTNPFYVVVSGSMIPVIDVYDIIVVQERHSFEDVGIGDIIVFNRPEIKKVVVHRIVSVTNEDPREVRTKGDNNPESIPGIDYPITNEEYIGRVMYTASHVEYGTKLIEPPVNFAIIALVLGVVAVWHVTNARKIAGTKAEPGGDRPDKAKSG
ncbi:MAG: signal peptidase I [Nitrosopumilus sp. H8]|nr:MAG: signal peptidase I [Nitrosopumilus sp. H13]RNJ79973.1 MAG: signal peptidase I [Nitrosopumilus sp. H8]